MKTKITKKIFLLILIIFFSLVSLGVLIGFFSEKTTIGDFIAGMAVFITTGILYYNWITFDKRELKKLESCYTTKERLLENEYNRKKDILENEYTEKNEMLENEHNGLKEKIKKLEENLSELDKEINDANIEHTLSLITPMSFDNSTSSEIKTKLSLIKVSEKELIKSDQAVIKIDNNMTKKEFNAQSKQIIKSFVAETNLLFEKVTTSNFDAYRNKTTRCYEELNKIYQIDNVKLSLDFLKTRLNILNLINEFNLKKDIEKEQQKAIREQMLEEEKIRKEIEKKKKEIEKEYFQFDKELKKMFEYMSKSNSDVEKKFYIDKIKELQNKLEILEHDKTDILNRESNTRAGFVYIISNIGSFGQDIYKIGMTRRLEPMDRIKELSSASVPFEFDVHAMIFSEDAPSLENALHNKFRKYSVNKVNNRKEFFRIPLNEIKLFVSKEFDLSVEFTEIAKAQEFYETLEIENNYA